MDFNLLERFNFVLELLRSVFNYGVQMCDKILQVVTFHKPFHILFNIATDQSSDVLEVKRVEGLLELLFMHFVIEPTHLMSQISHT